MTASSRSVCEAAPIAEVGQVLDVSYASANKALELRDGSALFLVTVRPRDERLWLVAVLESPKLAGDARATNTTPIRDVAPCCPCWSSRVGSA